MNLLFIRLFVPAPRANAVLFSFCSRESLGCRQAFGQQFLVGREFAPALQAHEAAFRTIAAYA
ncbi:MAG TPA: hypothetical protein DDW24_10805 [Blastocatellia bacterium]|nr:hypothetical protein [Blastocatellia bacterium]